MTGNRNCAFDACGEIGFLTVTRTYNVPGDPKSVLNYLAQRPSDPIPLTGWSSNTFGQTPVPDCYALAPPIIYTAKPAGTQTSSLTMQINGLLNGADPQASVHSPVPCPF